ncbi:hypothetical protein EH223_06780 [candidate division KSB1 bacterium]|nr:hypothetical protein [candidate division KSB1 bacterium]RQW04762.1 MAG: hypothetical protein EH223_06780 [candidate division KSB1 bacterium]
MTDQNESSNQDAWPTFKTLFEQHQENVLNLCYRFVQNWQDAEDLFTFNQ